ncbi:E3 ubiquitin-protein ligase Mdm2 [Denticeps clupeoides]|nr:E3 ubiquitin-protein ligase Mdm2 [Denticeps clupeoides]XP_028810494.1 E3 ubiquitin-protein ligase Mdm2 [Denticeps clupeoides]
MAEHFSNSQVDRVAKEKLVRPKLPLQTLLQHAGAEKEVFTLKEVMFYLGKYIMRKQLYDQQQQHIVRCGGDALGTVLGVDSFSVKEPRTLYSMISKNLMAVNNQEGQSALPEPRSQNEPDRGPEEANSNSSTSARRRRRSSDPDAIASEEGGGCERRKRHKSDSLSLTFDDSLSWCVIGGLPGLCSDGSSSSEFSDSRSNTEVSIAVSEDTDESEDSDSDNFSVEFEVESINSDAYSEHDEASVSGDDEVYEVTIFGAEEDDSFDEDTEITEADYWKCSKCEELNPPLPRNCNRCWTLRSDWLPEDDIVASATPAPNLTSGDKTLPPKPSAAALEEGLDVPDGKRAPSNSPPAAMIAESQDSACSQPSTSTTGNTSAPSSQEEVPELERFNSQDACLPASCLEPCVICQSRPKNGCIVHGRTGHLMACYTCAKKLKNRNKLCPVCREPIQSVVLTYFS